MPVFPIFENKLTIASPPGVILPLYRFWKIIENYKNLIKNRWVPDSSGLPKEDTCTIVFSITEIFQLLEANKICTYDTQNQIYSSLSIYQNSDLQIHIGIHENQTIDTWRKDISNQLTTILTTKRSGDDIGFPINLEDAQTRAVDDYALDFGRLSPPN